MAKQTKQENHQLGGPEPAPGAEHHNIRSPGQEDEQYDSQANAPTEEMAESAPSPLALERKRLQDLGMLGSESDTAQEGFGAYVANTFLIWHSDDSRTPEEVDRGILPKLMRVELKPGDTVPLCVPFHIQKQWAQEIARMSPDGYPIYHVRWESQRKAIQTPAGPPRVELPVGPMGAPHGAVARRRARGGAQIFSE